ncbi:aquaporin-like protein [Xylariaceae sp. FL1272]|nr:aquaporin-like protein [Xylariaceae sp. FL1272]
MGPSSGTDERIERLHTHDLELGATEAVQQHYARHVIERRPVTQRRLDFEHRRPRWLREMLGEGIGVFFYVFPGLASTAAFILNLQSPVGVSAFSSFFQIGLAYAIGIAFAVIVAAPTSGGHFSPAVTISFAIWQGFPWKKVPYYIFSQVFGSFLAGVLVMGMYRPQIAAYEAELLAAGAPLVSSTGPAGIFISLPAETETNLGFIVLTEFFVCSFLAILIWACLDRANPFIAASTAPFVIGMGYAVSVWGFAGVTISLNTAKELGCLFAAAIWYKGEAFSYMNYAPIGILVNIPATIFGTAIYEFVLRDSVSIIGAGGALHEDGEEGLKKHISRPGVLAEH